MAIGVAVSDSPTGPFRDAIGKPLYEDGKWDHIDPTVMIDDAGQAWLMWGNPQVYYAKLNEDMMGLVLRSHLDQRQHRREWHLWSDQEQARAFGFDLAA